MNETPEKTVVITWGLKTILTCCFLVSVSSGGHILKTVVCCVLVCDGLSNQLNLKCMRIFFGSNIDC